MVTRSTPYIGTHIGVSVRLVICRTTIGMIDSVAIGVWSAVRQYSAADRIVSFLFTGTPKNLTNYGAATFKPPALRISATSRSDGLWRGSA